ncbi:SDR family oxidoreductase [Candidatus Thioglobus sp.]|nr:SDR family oxidoreductase [Candidatus Thioglobus sp.]
MHSLEMRKTILITGGFGFLGGRLGQFLSENYNVILGGRSDKNKPNWPSVVKTSIIDWDNETSLNNSCNLVDIVIHASGLNAQECSSDPEKASLVNGVYTQNLVKAAINQRVKKVIYLSTAHVYSDNLLGVITEDTPTINTHPYATSHISGENAILLAIRQGHIEGTVVRIANTFGRPVSKDVNCWMLLVNDLCKQAVIKKSLTLNSNSKTVRDFVTIKDFCSVIGLLIEGNNTNNIVNIGSGKACTIVEMATRVQKKLPKCLRI